MKLFLLLLKACILTSLFSGTSFANLNQPVHHTQLVPPFSSTIVIMPRVALKSLEDDLTKTNPSITYNRVYNIRHTEGLVEGYYYWREASWHYIDIPSELSQNLILEIIDQGNAMFTYITSSRVEECIVFSNAAIEEIHNGADVYEVMAKLIDAQVYLDLPQASAVLPSTDFSDNKTSISKPVSAWLILGITSILALIGFIFVQSRKKRKIIKEETPVSNDAKPTVNEVKSVQTSDDKATQYYNVDAISSETEARILAALVKLEQTTFFLNPDITLARMSSRMETNTKYLSHVIHTHRGKAIPTYINNLRINYVVKKLEEDAVFRKYKISHLAALTGFSSHSKFSSEFKRVVGKSPSKFISKLNKMHS